MDVWLNATSDDFLLPNRIVGINEVQHKTETFLAVASYYIRFKYNMLNVAPPVVVR